MSSTKLNFLVVLDKVKKHTLATTQSMLATTYHSKHQVTPYCDHPKRHGIHITKQHPKGPDIL